MKKIFLTLSLSALGLFANAQSNLYQNIKKIITESDPGINMENRLIAFNVWSINDAESREANKAFEKAYTVYEYALLKGGRKGIIVIAVNKENLSSEAVIMLTKDGIKKMIPVKLSDLEGLESSNSNSVFDSNGNEIYKNLSALVIFSSINHLITR